MILLGYLIFCWPHAVVLASGLWMVTASTQREMRKATWSFIASLGAGFVFFASICWISRDSGGGYPSMAASSGWMAWMLFWNDFQWLFAQIVAAAIAGSLVSYFRFKGLPA